ncbi:hypothetical protein [Micrococcus luteus]|uniref:hypothetical protein n=1 Tax=Micrococcus luteus TaxID=1270 RepID=UPI003EC0F52F
MTPEDRATLNASRNRYADANAVVRAVDNDDGDGLARLLAGMDADELRGTVLALARIITGTAPEADTLTG